MASFRINKILLISSNFKLNPEVEPGRPGEFTIEVSMTRHQKVDNNLIVSVEVAIVAMGQDNSELLKMAVQMDGLFDVTGDDSVGPSEDYLANVNAPAIIYPFVREHVASVTAKAGIEAILIPPFNFVEHYQKKLEDLHSDPAAVIEE